LASRKSTEESLSPTELRLLHAERRRIRLLYSLGDFQLALSACQFLYECDPQSRYNKIELRRFRCFETTLIIAYSRPFSQSEGSVPPLTLKMAKAKFTEQEKALHRRLIRMRNKVIAHSDRELMRMTTQTFDMPLRDRSTPPQRISTAMKTWSFSRAQDIQLFAEVLPDSGYA
jgi:hypothetical protein